MNVRSAVFCLMVTSVISLSLTNNIQAAEDWEFNLAPFYLWAINVDGDMTIGPVSNSVEVDFDDIYDNLDTAFIVHFEAAYKSNWGVLVDVNFLDLEEKESIPSGLTRKVGLDLTMAEVSGFHRWMLDDHWLDLIVGVRYATVNGEVGILGGPTPVEGDVDWIDPLVGVRWLWSFAEEWSLIARGDVGGLQVGSDFAWQTVGMIEWQPFKYASIIAGYRAVGMDYEEGSRGDRNYFRYDATIHGPVIGINFKW